MNWKEYKEFIKTVPETEGLELKQAFMWFHPERLPLGVVCLDRDVIWLKDSNKDETISSPLLWKVLDIRDNKALLLTKYAIACHECNDAAVKVPWKETSLNKWLNMRRCPRLLQAGVPLIFQKGYIPF